MKESVNLTFGKIENLEKALLNCIENNNSEKLKNLLKSKPNILNSLKNKLAPLLLQIFKNGYLELASIIIYHINQTISTKKETTDIENLLKLVDLYLSELPLGTWTIKDKNKVVETYPNRDHALGKTDKHTRELWEKHTHKLNLLREMINFLLPELKHYQDFELMNWHKEAVKLNGKYFSDDLSEDSDSEDERDFNNKVDNKRINKYQQIQSTFDETFWEKTRRTTPRKVGLEQTLNDIKLSGKSSITIQKINEAQSKLIYGDNLEKRATLNSYEDRKTKKFIAQFRGINYMNDRWSPMAKRYHYHQDEVGKTQFTESVLKTLPFDFYTELNDSNDFNHNKKIFNNLLALSEKIKQNHQLLSQTNPCIAYSVKPTHAPYVFNSASDYLQHSFSNGVSPHLLEIKNLREKNPEYWGEHFLNAFNYSIAAGDRPYHSLKYAVGLKEYYQHNFNVRYNQDGSIINSHAGKIYIILNEVDEFLNDSSLNRVTQMYYMGKMPMDHHIASELETSFVGNIPGEKIIYQMGVKFPSFNKAYKNIYEIKYGMNKSLYESFQYLIKNTEPESTQREAVINLLKEWLCAYHETLLLEIAQQEASNRNGELTYIDYGNTESQKPDIRPFTKGHNETQNQVHTLQELRWELGKHYNLKKGEIDFLPQGKINLKIKKILNDDESLTRISRKIKIAEVSGTKSDIISNQISHTESTKKMAKNIIHTYRHTFFPKVNHKEPDFIETSHSAVQEPAEASQKKHQHLSSR